MRTSRQILASIVADVEAMKRNLPYEAGNADPDHWFGPFGEAVGDYESYSGHSIQWPNLGILIEEAKERLKK